MNPGGRPPTGGGKPKVPQNANADESMLREKLRIAGRRGTTDAVRGPSPNSETSNPRDMKPGERPPSGGGKPKVPQNANADESMLKEKLRIAGRRGATDTNRGSSPDSETKVLSSGTIREDGTKDSKKALLMKREKPPSAYGKSQSGESTVSEATMGSEMVAEKTIAGRRNMVKEKPDRPGVASSTLVPPGHLPARRIIDTAQRAPEELVGGIAKEKKGLTDSMLDEKLRLAGRRHPAKQRYYDSNKVPEFGATGTNTGSTVPLSNTLGAELKSSTDGTHDSSSASVNRAGNQQHQTNEKLVVAGRSSRSTGATSLPPSGSDILKSPSGKISKEKEPLALAASVGRLFPPNRAVNSENEDDMVRIKADAAGTGQLALALAGSEREPEAPEANNEDDVSAVPSMTSRFEDSGAPGAFRVLGFDAPNAESEDSIQIGYKGESVRDLPKHNDRGEHGSTVAPQGDALLVQAHVVLEDHDEEAIERGLIVEAELAMPESWWKRNQVWLVGFAVVVIIAIIVPIVVTTVDSNNVPTATVDSPRDDNDTTVPTAAPTTFADGVEKGILNLVLTRLKLPSDLEQPGTPQYKALQWVTNRTLEMGAQGYNDTRVLQQYSLATLFLSTNITESSWSNRSGWLDEPNECEWKGVQCDDAGLVTALVLPRNGLSGTLSVELVLLSDSLAKLDLSGNELFGSLASEIGQLALLTDLLLGSNRFSQGIPAAFGRLTNLVNLDLSDNVFKSEIPSEIGLLSNARSINFGSNDLIGEIPSDIWVL